MSSTIDNMLSHLNKQDSNNLRTISFDDSFIKPNFPIPQFYCAAPDSKEFSYNKLEKCHTHDTLFPERQSTYHRRYDLDEQIITDSENEATRRDYNSHRQNGVGMKPKVPDNKLFLLFPGID